MRRFESSQRLLALLVAGSLFLVYGPLYGQVGVRLIHPVASSIEASTEALQQARTSLLEARLAVDDALYEVDRALALLTGESPALPEPIAFRPADTKGDNALSALQVNIQARCAQTAGSLKRLFAGLSPGLEVLGARFAELSTRLEERDSASEAATSLEATPEFLPVLADDVTEETGAGEELAGSLAQDYLLFPESLPGHDALLDPVVLPTEPESDTSSEEAPLPEEAPGDADVPPFDATVVRPEGLRLKGRR